MNLNSKQVDMLNEYCQILRECSFTDEKGMPQLVYQDPYDEVLLQAREAFV